MATMTIDQAVETFCAELSAKQSRRTVMTYTTALNHFREFLASDAKLPSESTPASALTVDHALDYVRWLDEVHFEDREMPKSTLATYLASVSRFYDLLQRTGMASFLEEDRQRMIKTFQGFRKGASRPLPVLPNDDTVDRMIAAARSVPADSENHRAELCRLRNIAVLETLHSTGMRVGELVALRRGDLDHQNRTAVVRGRGDRQRFAQFDDTAWYALEAYLEARADGAGGKALHSLPVFARHDRAAGRKTLSVSTNTIRRIFYACAKRANLATPFTPHALRHAFAKRVLDSTGDLATTQDMLGHASPTTTRIYSKLAGAN